MSVNSLSITKRELRKFEGTVESNKLDIIGEYEVTIKNEGLLPTLASRYEVEKLSFTSANKVIITEKGAGIGRMSSGATETVNISFKISGNKNQLMSLARNGCNGNRIKCKTKEKISGALLQVPIEKKLELPVSSGSCSLESGVGEAPEVPEPTSPQQPQAIQTLTMRFDNEVSPTEVTAGEENSWVINGNNVNEVNQIIVEPGDGSTTSTRREIQAQNPENDTRSDLGQVFSHTYESQGQYTIVAEAINSNGQTVGSARYDVTVNPQVTTDPVEPEPTNPANFNITVDNKNEPVNPGGQMVIDYTVENTGEASGTGNITLNVDGQRADSSRKSVNAGSSTSGTVTATAPQINSSSVIFRPRISAEGVESNTVSPSFEVKQQENDSGEQNGGIQQPEPAALNLQITGTSSPVNIGEDLNVQYRVINTGGQSTNATIDATTSSSNGRQSRVVETVNPGQNVQGGLTIPSTAYGIAGEKTATLQVDGDSSQADFTVQQQGNNGEQNQSYELPDFNKDGEINDEDVTDAAFNEELQFSNVEEYSRAIEVDDGDGILTPEQAQQINIDAIERVRDASNYYRLPDYNGDGQINQDDYVDAGFDDNIDFDDVEIYAAAIDRDAQDDNDGALTPEQREQFNIAALDRIKENSQNQQAQSFVPKSMGEVADNKF